jgi:hypothetical protein
MSDIADSIKHGALRDPARNSSLRVEANFEYDSLNRFRFLRNQIVVAHATHGELDFMAEASRSILFWLDALEQNVRWDGVVAEAKNEFYQTAFLYFHPEHQVAMPDLNLRFYRRGPSGELVLGYPPEILFSVYDHPNVRSRRRHSGAL